MTSLTDHAGFEDRKAIWIAKPTIDHRSWTRYRVEVSITIETGGAGILFGVRDENDYYGCELDAEARAVTVYSLKDGVRREYGKAPAPELAVLPVNIEVSIVQGIGMVQVSLDGLLVLTTQMHTLQPGTIGFKTEAGQSVVYRGLWVYDADGRALYVNRFYDPSTLQFTAGQIDSSGRHLRLDENTVSLCESPVSMDSPLFRKAFIVAADVIKAVIRVYTIGWYELSINGCKVDNRVLTPANTPYDRKMLFDTYDVTTALQLGGNAIGLWLGNGYNMNYSPWGWKWKRDKAAILELDIELAGGTTQRIVTDETWLTTNSPILVNDIYDGETFDGRKAQPGWDTFEFQGGEWLTAVAVSPPEGTLEPNSQPPIRSYEPIEPVRMLSPRKGVIVYDFGQNIAGWMKVRVEGPAGSRLTLKYSELLDSDGNIDPWTNRHAKAADVYILNGQGVEMYEPRFTYHGFRYVEASGEAELIRMQAVPIHSDVREIGQFASSDALLNQIQRNIRWSLLNNLVSIPTDCCQRDERTPCQMDSAVVEEMAIHHFDMQQYYRKWLGDIEDSLGNPDWSGDKVALPWYLYWYYGDEEALHKYYEPMTSYIDDLADRWPDGIVQAGFGDWCAPNVDGWGNYFHEVSIVNTSLYYRHASIVSAAAGVLQRKEDQQRYAALAMHIKRSFHERFYQGDGVYGSGSQTAQLMPLAFDIVPEEHIAQAVRRLVAAIATKGNHLDTGIYGTRYLMDVLADHGHIDLAYEVLTQEDYPGFGWQIAQGATTLWEQWSFKGDMHSHDHAMFGGIGVSFFTRLGGIEPLSPGYAKISIRPCVPNGLAWVVASIDTVKGRIVSAWRKEGDRLHVEIEIPAQTTAVIKLPAAITPDTGEEHEVGPGRYRYTV
ncbi:family 78 glycoside hydrolase catalytic domain [Paenibacillus yanchengensis]|uniref:alpha-L-rhamnosidase n=1 Tax=Paenibacillus yanchengensis TaxID=2035833 RepID=A0ABW4YQH4_9BACL